MEGTCKCGGRIHERNHKVHTADGAKRWSCEENDLPLLVTQSMCASCGRQKTEVFGHKGTKKVSYG